MNIMFNNYFWKYHFDKGQSAIEVNSVKGRFGGISLNYYQVLQYDNALYYNIFLQQILNML